ncbi:MAG: Rpn family recombination-promoting nuclease/putative transposase [Moorea sp. SIO2B7]|nr:Rpn family recombination-promoting nuclease/putative transposase [Moorena sp. SIO2B7]
MSYDNTCKYLVEKYPAAFVRWLLGSEPKTIRVLKTELNLEPIHADSILLLRMGRQILHLEFQTEPTSKPPLPLRMLDYSVRLKRKYRCSVVQVVIFLQETTNTMAFTEEYRDETTIHQYRILRLWEQEANLLLNNTALLPLAPLTKSNSPQSLLREVANKVNRIEDDEQKQSLASCTEILAGLRFEENLIRSLFREDIMKESVIYQSILREGRQEEARFLVMNQLEYLFGKLESRLVNKIETLSREKLEQLAKDLLDFSEVEDLDAWLGYPEL